MPGTRPLGLESHTDSTILGSSPWPDTWPWVAMDGDISLTEMEYNSYMFQNSQDKVNTGCINMWNIIDTLCTSNTWHVNGVNSKDSISPSPLAKSNWGGWGGMSLENLMEWTLPQSWSWAWNCSQAGVSFLVFSNLVTWPWANHFYTQPDFLHLPNRGQSAYLEEFDSALNKIIWKT